MLIIFLLKNYLTNILLQNKKINKTQIGFLMFYTWNMMSFGKLKRRLKEECTWND